MPGRPGALERDPVRLALITRRYPPLLGGAEKVLSYLAPALAAEGAAVTVLTAAPPGRNVPGREEVPTPAGRLTVVRLPTAPVRWLGTWLYMNNLRRWLARNPIDLAYVSMLKHDAYVAVGEGRRLGFPVVLRPEGAGATGDLAWQSWGRFGRTIGRRCRTADAVVSIAGAITEELIAADFDPAKIHALPNGVPVPDPPWQRRDDWPRDRRARASSPFQAGNSAPEKGLHALVAAWPRVRERHPRARLTLLGEGPERTGLEALAARLGLSEAVALPGATDDPGAALRAADLFVHPSREEGMSIALLEAMALGMPLVASSIPGNRRLIAERKHGRLAPPDDPEGLAQAILAQWADLDRAIHMGRAARQRVVAEFSIQAVARGHLALFASLIRRRAPGASEAEII